MTHLTLPSEVEPESLSELVADGRSVRGSLRRCRPEPAAVAGTRRGRPAPRPAVAIPDSTAALLDGMPEYGD